MRINNHIFRVVMILAILLAFLAWNAFFTATSLAETTDIILYVKSDAVDGTCTDWENACDLQTALGLAEDGDEVWVAEGVHHPGSGSDPRTVTFQMESGVALYGGFDGTETQRDERNWVTHQTILSGDIDRDGILDDGNAYHVVTGSGVDQTSIMDGFIITAGNADEAPESHGGGIVNDAGNPTLINVTFSGNSAILGGGMYNYDSTPMLTNVTFSGNSADYGGGMYNDAGSPLMTNITFTDNTAIRGGGMSNWISSPTLTDVTFSGNSADFGGGMYNFPGSPTLTNIIFFDNTANFGGGMSNYNGSNPTLTNVIFSGNSAVEKGGGIHNSSSSPTLANVTFTDNTAHSGGGIYSFVGREILTNVIFSGNLAVEGGGMYNWASSPTLTNVTFSTNLTDERGGGMLNNYRSNPTLTNAIVWGNTPDQIYNEDLSTAIVSYSDIQGGYAGTGNINADPLFVDAASGNLRLQRSSPAIDAGDNEALPAGVTTDLDGSPRIVGDIVDMGAYEVQAGADIIYVDRDAPGPLHDGLSWESAFTGVQSGLAAAGAGNEVWVAEGTYYQGVIGNRNATFGLKSGVELYGGFSGTEVQRDERDWDGHLTVLSGDLDRDGILDDGNAYHVVTGSGVDDTAVLDSFTITGGKADGIVYPRSAGAGIINDAGSPTLTNITFSGNSASYGGGMYNYTSNPTLVNVTFSGNTAHSGGGMYNNASNPALTNITFSGNTANYGGGMYNWSESSPMLTNITFSGNSADYGGGIYNYTSSNPNLTNAIVWGNTPDQIYNNGGTATVSFSDIEGGYPGTANINVDPLFVNADNGNLRLQYTSPAIDAGDNAAVPIEVTTDLDGNPRFVDIPGIPDTGIGDPPIVDMGAYEVQPYYSLNLPLIWK